MTRSYQLLFFFFLQARLILGDDHAQAAFDELEQLLRTASANRTGKTDSPLGDVLTVLLLVWTQPPNKSCNILATGVMPRALASSLVYPLLSSLVLRCDQHRRGVPHAVMAGAAAGAGCVPYSLVTLVRAIFSSTSTGHPPSSVIVLPESTFAMALIVELVLNGRIAAAAELAWRAHARPVTLYSAHNGHLFLRAKLEESVRTRAEKLLDGSRLAEALEILNNSL